MAWYNEQPGGGTGAHGEQAAGVGKKADIAHVLPRAQRRGAGCAGLRFGLDQLDLARQHIFEGVIAITRFQHNGAGGYIDLSARLLHGGDVMGLQGTAHHGGEVFGKAFHGASFVIG